MSSAATTAAAAAAAAAPCAAQQPPSATCTPGQVTLLRQCAEQSLQHHVWTNAIFLSERLLAVDRSVEHLYLLARCYMGAGQYKRLYHLLRGSHWHRLVFSSASANRHSEAEQHDDVVVAYQLQYLFGTCCMQLRRLQEAQKCFLQLASAAAAHTQQQQPQQQQLLDMEPMVHYWLGVIFRQESLVEQATRHLMRALELNPLLWCAVQQLAELGHNLNCLQAFSDDRAQLLLDLWSGSSSSSSSSDGGQHAAHEQPAFDHAHDNFHPSTPHQPIRPTPATAAAALDATPAASTAAVPGSVPRGQQSGVASHGLFATPQHPPLRTPAGGGALAPASSINLSAISDIVAPAQ